MSCENHTKKSKEVLSQNGGVLPKVERKRVSIKSIKEKLLNGKKLSDPEFQKLSQSVNKQKIILEAMKGRSNFSIDEILLFGKVANEYGSTVAHIMVRNGRKFSVEELILMKNPANSFGDTVAHEMVQNGHKFSVEELIQLGNPVDKGGLKVSHLMERVGHKFTAKEMFFLNFGCLDQSICDYAWRIEQGEEITMAEVIQYPDLIERYADRLI